MGVSVPLINITFVCYLQLAFLGGYWKDQYYYNYMVTFLGIS